MEVDSLEDIVNSLEPKVDSPTATPNFEYVPRGTKLEEWWGGFWKEVDGKLGRRITKTSLGFSFSASCSFFTFVLANSHCIIVTRVVNFKKSSEIYKCWKIKSLKLA